MDDAFKTSQMKDGGYSDPGGKDIGPGLGNAVYGSDLAPTGVSTEEAVRNELKTTQQLRGEHQLAEGDTESKAEDKTDTTEA